MWCDACNSVARSTNDYDGYNHQLVWSVQCSGCGCSTGQYPGQGSARAAWEEQQKLLWRSRARRLASIVLGRPAEDMTLTSCDDAVAVLLDSGTSR